MSRSVTWPVHYVWYPPGGLCQTVFQGLNHCTPISVPATPFLFVLLSWLFSIWSAVRETVFFPPYLSTFSLEFGRWDIRGWKATACREMFEKADSYETIHVSHRNSWYFGGFSLWGWGRSVDRLGGGGGGGGALLLIGIQNGLSSGPTRTQLSPLTAPLHYAGLLFWSGWWSYTLCVCVCACVRARAHMCMATLLTLLWEFRVGKQMVSFFRKRYAYGLGVESRTGMHERVLWKWPFPPGFAILVAQKERQHGAGWMAITYDLVCSNWLLCSTKVFLFAVPERSLFYLPCTVTGVIIIFA